LSKFYTDLWHALLGRRMVSDVDGSYIDNTGSSPMIRRVTPTASGDLFPHYGFDAWWGSHWNLNILWPMAWPEVMDGFCTTMVDMYRNGGLIPRGPSGGNYTFVMIGDPAVSFFAAAYHLGIRSWDVQKAYEGLRKNAFPGGIRDHAGYEHDANASAGGMSYYIQRGYVPEGVPGNGMHRDGASMTLEYAYQDWCLAQLALSLGKTQDAELFTKRSQNYRHLWNPKSSWMHPRTLDGEWITDFSPIGSGGSTKGFTEANSAIYTYFVPQDPQGLIALFGGADPFIQRLDSQFTKARPFRFIVPHGKHAEGWTDYENQPGLGMAYWFSYAGSPWLTQQWVRCIHDAAFSDVSPMGGYNGDEDQGQMGAYSALASMGLFALDGCASADPHYEITCPIFDTITIHLNPKYHPGKTFVIKTKNNAKENLYIQSAKLNGKDLNTFQFPCRALTAGGTLEIVAGPDPNKQWGVSGK
jgi:predicted alpha-1,2-mannosidase